MTESSQQPTPAPKKKEMSPEQAAMKAWDMIIQQAIDGELAPQGYRKIKQNKVVSNIQFLTIERVQRTATVACKTVRSYRLAMNKVIDMTIKMLEDECQAHEEKLAKLGVLDMGEKKNTQKAIFVSKVQIGTAKALKDSLARISPSVLDGMNPNELMKQAVEKGVKPKIEIVKS